MKIHQIFGLGLLAAVLWVAPFANAQNLDYGAVPSLTKPQGDQTAANQKLDFHADLFTGRFNYGIPIEVPPGRGGSEPALALQYNSSGGNGWCGVGWDLDLGYIQRETRHGCPITGVYDDSFGFVYSVAGQTGRLIKATDGTYRPEIDTAGLKFAYTGTYWIVTDKGGRTYKFGNISGARVSDASLGTFKWALTTIQDANGNLTSITYVTPTSDNQLYLSQIAYNANINSPTLSSNCTVTFGLESTNRLDLPGSAISGMDLYTSRRLKDIWVNCNSAQVRHYVLQYTSSTSTGKSLLQGVTEYGTDDTTHWPALSFNYSVQSKSFLPVVPWNITDLRSQSYITTYPGSSETQLIDVNGDGLPDWVVATYTNTVGASQWNHYLVQMNTGSGFGPAQNWAIANKRGDNTDMLLNLVNNADAINGGGSAISCMLEDIDGDGLPDRVMWSTNAANFLAVQLNSGSAFTSLIEWSSVPAVYFGGPGYSGYYYSPGVALPGTQANPGSFALSTLIDMNGDGLPDMVTTTSDPTKLAVSLNNGNGGFGGSFSSSPSAIWANYAYNNNYATIRSMDKYKQYADLVDMNGDGLPDNVQNGGIQLNLGIKYGFGTKLPWGMTNNETPIITDTTTYNEEYGLNSKQLLDINGDGLSDLVTANANGTYSVRYNTGRGFSSNVVTWSGVDTSITYGLNSWGTGSENNGGAVISFADMNGDGLPDRVMMNYNYGTYTNTCLLVQLNAGPYPDLLTGINNGIGGTVAVTYTNSTEFNNSDGTRSWLPHPVQVVTSVTANDGIRAGTQMTYNYTGGFYDPTYREFHGFAIVDATDEFGTRTRTCFHQGGGLNLSSSGEYQDSRFKAGMAYDVITYGTDGNQYRNILSQVTQVKIDPNGVYFPFVTNVFEIDTEIPGKARETLKQYSYFVTANNLTASSGNLRQSVFLGEVTNASYAYTYTRVPDVSAPIYTTYAYASLANTNIIDQPSSVTVSSDAAGNNILRQTLCQYFGASGNLQQKSEMVCPSTYANTFYTYDNYGNPKTSTDPMGIVTTLNYDSASATFLTLKATGNLTNSYQYDPGSGALLASTNEQGIVTANGYDHLWRPTSSAISTTVNGAASLTRSQFGHSLGGISGYKTYNYEVVSVNDPSAATGWHTTLNYLDGFGRPIQVRDATETNNTCRVSDIFYNWRGQLMSQSYPFFAAGTNYQSYSGTYSNTYTKFDAIGRTAAVYPLVKATISSGSFSSYSVLTGDGGSPVGPTSIDYNDGNNPWAVVITNALGKVHKYLRDSQGRTNQIVEVTSGGNYTTKLGYNLVGDLTNITDNASNTITFYYDLLGEKVAMTDPDMGYWQYDHDLDGRLKIQTDAKSQQIKMFYSDAAGRLTRREGWSAKGQCVSTNTWTYDSNAGDSSCTIYPGQLYQVTDDEGWQKFSYDPRNRTLASVRYLVKNGNSYTNQFAYDDADRLTATTYPNGGPTIANVFDGGQHLLQVTSGTNTFYTTKGYNELNQLNGVSFGNGAATTFSYYKASKRLNQILTIAAGSATIQSFTNRYDAIGNVIALQDLVSSHTNSASATISSASYDDLNRLMAATWSGYGTKNYGYNSVGNVLTNGESGISNYVYGAVRPHAVRIANGTWFTYDQNGSVVFRGRQRLDYSVNNQLYRVINTNGVTTFFGYDASGARLWEQSGTNALQVWIGNNYEEKNGQTLYHILANGQTVCTFDKTGTNVFEYYHPDYLTSTTLQTDKSGNQIQHYEYSAFGQTRYTQSTNVFKVSRLYTGQVLDDATGLYYYNARYYDPILGRFTQPDNIIPDLFNPQSYNRYSYCVNNPLRFTDPSGHGPIGDALFSQETYTSSYQLLTMHDSPGWRAVEIPVAIGGMVIATADTALNFASLGGKTALEGGAKGVIKAGLEAGGKVEGEKAGAKIVKAASEGADAEAKAAKKEVGSYTNHHESGKTYDGKGTRERSQISGKRVENETKDPHIATEFTPAKDQRGAFKQESERLDSHGGPKSENNYNKIESPGKNMRQQDGE